jgi:uncharacterized protein involved in high-affinity Fe2+ transport
MKRITIILLALACAALACTKQVPAAEPVALATGTTWPTSADLAPAGAAAVELDQVAVEPSKGCARVTAEQALHIRIDADPTAQVLAFAKCGDLVRVISTTDSAWWLVDLRGVTGYARSSFLERADCE